MNKDCCIECFAGNNSGRHKENCPCHTTTDWRKNYGHAYAHLKKLYQDAYGNPTGNVPQEAAYDCFLSIEKFIEKVEASVIERTKLEVIEIVKNFPTPELGDENGAWSKELKGFKMVLLAQLQSKQDKV